MNPFPLSLVLHGWDNVMSESPGTLAHYDTGIHPGQLSSRRWPPHPQIIKKCIGSLLTIELVCVMGQSPRAAGLYIEFHKTQIDIKVAQSVVSVTVEPLTCLGCPSLRNLGLVATSRPQIQL